jgi:hypothetical protein
LGALILDSFVFPLGLQKVLNENYYSYMNNINLW